MLRREMPTFCMFAGSGRDEGLQKREALFDKRGRGIRDGAMRRIASDEQRCMRGMPGAGRYESEKEEG